MGRWRFDGFNDTYYEYWKVHEDIINGCIAKLVMKYDSEKGKIWPHIANAASYSERWYNARGIVAGGESYVSGAGLGYAPGEMGKIVVRGFVGSSCYAPFGVSGTHTFSVGDIVWGYDLYWPRTKTYTETGQSHVFGIVVGRYGTTGDIGTELFASDTPVYLDCYVDFKKLLEADDVVRFETD